MSSDPIHLEPDWGPTGVIATLGNFVTLEAVKKEARRKTRNTQRRERRGGSELKGRKNENRVRKEEEREREEGREET